MQVGTFQFRPSLWPTVATLVVLPLLLTLGVWQLERSRTKEAQQAVFLKRPGQAPLQLDSPAEREALRDQPAEFRFRSVHLEGRYKGREQYLLDNRTHDGVAGYYVFTALQFAGSGAESMLVNRGWTPVGERRDELPLVDLETQPVSIRGQLAEIPGSGLLLGETGHDQTGWPRVVQTIDLDAMSDELGTRLLPLVARLAPDEPNGFVREWQAYVGISPERHRGYAVQWFSLGTALVIIYLVVNLRRAR